jgi:hypothetical protein
MVYACQDNLLALARPAKASAKPMYISCIFGLLTLFSLEKVLCDWKQGMEQLSVQWSTGV